MTARIFVALGALLALGACSLNRDLDVPEAPRAGAVLGALDTDFANSRVSPADQAVTLIDEAGLKRVATTDADGGFGYADVRPGLYALEVKVPTFAPLVVPNVRVLAGAPTDVGLLQPTSLRTTPEEGRVTGVVSAPAGADVSGATVQFLLAPNLDLLGSLTLGFDGVFSERLPPGTYVLRASHPDFTTAELADVVVPRGATVDLRQTPLVLGLNPATLSGVVLREVDGTSTPVPAENATVTLGNGATTTTDSAGGYVLTQLPAGTFALRGALAAHFDPAPTRQVTLRAGEATDAGSFTLSLVRGSIEGAVELSDRAPIDVVSVSAVSTTTGRGFAAVVSPDPAQPWRGTFSISGVPLDSYEVQASKARYSRATAQVTLAGGIAQAGTLVLALQQGDFLIDDGDATNVAGYTRTRDVTLRFTGFPATGVVSYRVAEDQSFPDAGFVPYTGLQQPYTLGGAGDGSKTVYAQYRDSTGSTSPTFQNSIVLDTTPPPAPTVAFVSTGTPNGALRFTKVNQSIPLTIVGSDDRGLAGMRVAASSTLDANGALQAPKVSVQATTTLTRASTADGAQAVYVQLVDNAGNLSPLGTDTIIVDATPPVVGPGTLTIPRGLRATVDGYTNTPFVDVQVAATPQANGEALYLKLANSSGAELDAALYAPVRPVFSWIVSPGDGLKTVSGVLMDSAGNTSGVAAATITVDTAPPTPVNASLATGLVKGSPVRVNVSATAMDLSPTQAVTASENTSFLNPVGPLPASGFLDVPLTTIPSAPGVYPAIVHVRFRDRAGNDAVISLPFIVDTEAPTGSLRIVGTLGDGSSDEGRTATANVTVVADAIQSASGYYLGDASLTACPDPAVTPYAALPAGGLIPTTLGGSGTTRQVRGCFRDAAGNVYGGLVGSAWVPSASISLDAVAPTGCSLSLSGYKVPTVLADGGTVRVPAPAGRTATRDVAASLAGCAADTAEFVLINGSVTCSNALTGWEPLRSPVTHELTAVDGTKTVSACVRDATLNVASVTSQALVLDTLPPDSASALVEFGDGIVNAAEARARVNDGGVAIAVSATWADATELELDAVDGRTPITAGVVFTPTVPSPRMVRSEQLNLNELAQPFDLSASLVAPDRVTLTVGAVFRDDVGNATARATTQMLVDTVSPAPPVLVGASPGNRSATLFWTQSPSFDVARYEVGFVTGTAPALTFNTRGTAPTGAQTGAAIGLTNQLEYRFAARTVDFAGNPSVPSNEFVDTVGWRTATVPLNSPYPLRPLDVAVRGDELFLTFSERDVDGTVETGNLRMAYSPDRGRTWSFSTIDSVFGWNRRTGNIQFSDGLVVVTTVGSDQDPTTTNFPQRGEAKIYSSTDGLSWTKYSDASLPLQANWADVSGVGAVLSGPYANLFFLADPGATNVLRNFYTLISTGFIFGGGLYTYWDFPDGNAMSTLRLCDGNYAKFFAWRDTANVGSLTHRFLYDTTWASTEGSQQTIESAVQADLDLACGAIAGRTSVYAVTRTGTNLAVRAKAGNNGSWLGFAGASGARDDVDARYPPRLHAASTGAAVVYRSTTGGLYLGSVTDTGGATPLGPMVWRRVEASPLQGAWPVVGGEAIDDLVIAYTDTDMATLTVKVPELRGVLGRGLPGIDTASLSWTSGGLSDFIVQASDSTSFVTSQTYLTNEAAFDVAAPAGDPLYHRIGARDAFGQGSDQGEVWQMAPFQQGVVIPSPAALGTAPTSSAGVVAHDDVVLVLPPYGLRGSGDSDLTLYRSVDRGANWAAFQPPAAVTTSTGRALDGANGRAVLAYKTSGLAGLRARLFSSLTGSYPAETVIDATINADHVAVGTDRVSAWAIVSSNVATDQLGVAWSSDGVSFTNRARLTIPDAATYTISDVAVWRVDAGRLVIAWRQSASGIERVYFAESTNQGTSFGTPVLMVDGSTGVGGNQAVSTATILRGAGNDAYSLLGRVSQASASPPRSANLYLSVTGTDHPPTSGNLSTILLDQDPAVPGSFDLLSTPEGHAVVYQATNLVGAVTEASLKMALCQADCHLAKNWFRRTLATASATSATRLSPVLAQSTVSGNGVPRWYVTYRQGNQLKVLRGGLVRRVK